MLFQPLLKKYGPQPPAPKPEVTQPQNSQTQPSQPQSPGGAGATPSAVPQGTAAATSTKQAHDESETIVENDLYRIVFTNRSGQVKSWILKNYKDRPDGNPLE